MLILGIGAAALLLGRKAVKRATRSNPRKRKAAKRRAKRNPRKQHARGAMILMRAEQRVRADARKGRGGVLWPSEAKPYGLTFDQCKKWAAEERGERTNPRRRRKGRRISPDQAASRLAWWRWHHNPKGYHNIEKLPGKDYYTGYGNGVWRIWRYFRNGDWLAVRSTPHKELRARTLGEVSKLLSQEAAKKTNPRRRRKAPRRK